MLDTKASSLRDIKKGKNPWQEVPPEKLAICTSFDSFQQAIEEGIRSHLIYVPPHNEMNFESFNTFFEYCYELEDITIWVDEVYSVCPTPHTMPEYYQAVLTRGRDRNVVTWSLTQRPKGIPSQILAQSTHFFVFNIVKPDDRKELYKVTGAPEMLVRPEDYNFWYWADGMDNAIKAVLELKGGED